MSIRENGKSIVAIPAVLKAGFESIHLLSLARLVFYFFLFPSVARAFSSSRSYFLNLKFQTCLSNKYIYIYIFIVFFCKNSDPKVVYIPGGH